MIRAFVAGWPVSHSLSPVLHGHWLKHHQINGSYEAIPVPPESFAGFLEKLHGSGLVGGNVTIPHKEAAFAAARCDSVAKAIGAVNTLWLEGTTLCGTNTDAFGFAANLDQHAPHWSDCEAALVIGAGGASRAVLHALLERGIPRIHLANRTHARAEQLAGEFGPRILPCPWPAIGERIAGCRLVVNTSSLGMTGNDELELDLSGLSDKAVVTDIVYSPLETALLRQAREIGLTAVDGLGMLLHQAVPGFERWFGLRPTVDDDLRAAVLRAIAVRDGPQGNAGQ